MNEKNINNASRKPAGKASNPTNGKTEKHPERTVRADDSEAAYRAAIETSTEGFWVTDLEGRILEVNDAYVKQSGYAREELLRMRISDIEAQESSAETAAHIRKIVQAGNDVFETLHRTKDGTVWHAEVNASYWPIKEGRFFSFIRDITERRLAEAAVLVSERKFAAIFSLSHDPTTITELDTDRIIDVNEAAAKWFGRSRSELIGMTTADVRLWHDPADRDRMEQELHDKGEVVDREFRLRHHTGEVRDTLFSSKFLEIGGKKYLLSRAHDITERKRAEKELAHSHDMMRYIIEHNRSAVAVHDRDLKYIYVSQRYLDEYKVKEKDVIGKHHYDVFPDLPKKWRDVHQRALAGDVLSAEDDPYFRADGTIDWTRWECRPWYQSDGSIGGIIVYTEVITERKKAEEALRQSEERFRQLAENITEVFYISNLHTHQMIYISPAYELIWGRSCESLYAHPYSFVEAIHPDYRERVMFSLERQIQGEKTEELYQIIRPDKSVRWIWDRAFPIRNADGNVVRVIGIAEDITDRKRMEEEIQRSHKLESIGILAGGIAHDFNNLLTGIMNNIYLSKMHIAKESESYRYIESAEKALLRASDLTQQLLTFSRGGAPVKRASSISDIVQETAEFALRGSNVKCEYKISGNIWPVNVDRGQISQVIQNIIINSEQAMPEGGVIMVEIENAIVGSGTGIPQKDGSFVKITIHDNGIGISDEHLQKIFDPFFTTKEKGRGLGLAIAYSIVKNHDGYISVESEAGHGTTFDIYLPASEGQIVTEQVSDKGDQTGAGRVLIMDDEEVIRSSLGEILTHMGYDVELARDGAEAAEIYNKTVKSSKPFDAVILDLTVPGGMGGEETIKILREIDSKVKAIVSSGYSDNPVLANFRDYGFRGFLFKPYKDPAELNKIIQSVITDLNA